MLTFELFSVNYQFMSIALFLLGCIFLNDLLLFFMYSGYLTIVSFVSVGCARSVFMGPAKPLL